MRRKTFVVGILCICANPLLADEAAEQSGAASAAASAAAANAQAATAVLEYKLDQTEKEKVEADSVSAKLRAGKFIQSGVTAGIAAAVHLPTPYSAGRPSCPEA